MYSDYVKMMIAMRDHVAPIAEGFGIPTVRSLIIRRRENKSTYYTEVKPRPAITTIQPEPQDLVGMEEIQLAVNTFEVKGVSRAYTRSQLVNSRVDYIVDGILEGQNVTGGFVCTLVSVAENALTWDLIVRSLIGEQKLY